MSESPIWIIYEVETQTNTSSVTFPVNTQCVISAARGISIKKQLKDTFDELRGVMGVVVVITVWTTAVANDSGRNFHGWAIV